MQPFLIGAFNSFTKPMLILGAMDLAAAVMLLCAPLSVDASAWMHAFCCSICLSYPSSCAWFALIFYSSLLETC